MTGLRPWLAPVGSSIAVAGLLLAVPALAQPTRAGAGPDRETEIVGPERLLDPGPPPANEPGSRREVDVTGYRVGGRVLVVYYRTEHGDCTGYVRRPRVRETSGAVTVTLQPFRDLSQMCTGLPASSSLEVVLESPLAARLVRDGNRGGELVPLERPFTSSEGEAHDSFAVPPPDPGS